MFDPLKHNYYKKLIGLNEEGKMPRGCLYGVDVYHDDWCRIYRGGYCNCDPDIIIWPPPDRN